MKIKGHVVKGLEEGSIGQEMGIEAGDRLLEINGEEIVDIFDYQYLIQDEYIEVLVEKEKGGEWLLEIDKEYGEDLGMNTVPVAISVSSASLTKCRRGCGKRFISKTMIPGFLFCRGIT